VAQRRHVVGAEQALAAERGTEDDEDPLDQLRLEARLARDLLDRNPLLETREELLDETEGEPALAARPLQLLERVTALAHPRHHPRLRRGGNGPTPPPHRHDPLRGPALQRAGRHPGPPRGLGE
jgi:hypothetical protein